MHGLRARCRAYFLGTKFVQPNVAKNHIIPDKSLHSPHIKPVWIKQMKTRTLLLSAAVIGLLVGGVYWSRLPTEDADKKTKRAAPPVPAA
jgi:hypothetical protein